MRFWGNLVALKNAAAETEPQKKPADAENDAGTKWQTDEQARREQEQRPEGRTEVER
jgi:hypothetical protein